MRPLEKRASKKKYLSELIKLAVTAKDLLRVAQGMKRRGTLVRAASPRGREMLGRRTGNPFMHATRSKRGVNSVVEYARKEGLRGPDLDAVKKAVHSLAPYYSRVYQPKGGLNAQLKMLRKRFPKGVEESLSGMSGEGKKLTNLLGIRHEGAELAAVRRFTPPFHGHASPAPMLNDMNVVAGLKGPGSEEVRRVFRNLRKGELDLLGRAVYPKANRSRIDPRRILSPGQYRKQKAAFDTMQQLGLPGNRLSRHKIKNIGRLYEEAGQKGTKAFSMATDPRPRPAPMLGRVRDYAKRKARSWVYEPVTRKGQKPEIREDFLANVGTGIALPPAFAWARHQGNKSRVKRHEKKFREQITKIRALKKPMVKNRPTPLPLVKAKPLKKLPTKERAWGLR